jgi:hypothetical protein
MKNLNYVFISIIAIMLMNCSGAKITTDQSDTADFKNYKTFRVVHLVSEEEMKDESLKKTELNQKRINNAVINEAQLKGMTLAEKPDAYLVWSMGIDLKTSYSTHTNYTGGAYMGYRGGRGRRGYGGGYGGMGSSYSTTSETETIFGKLSISLIDAETEELLWLGAGEKDLKTKNNKIEENINKAATKIMKEFPIGGE